MRRASITLVFTSLILAQVGTSLRNQHHAWAVMSLALLCLLGGIWLGRRWV